MSTYSTIKWKAAGPRANPEVASALQRKCACGGNAGRSGECEQCRAKRETGLQRKAMNKFGNGDGFNRTFSDVGVTSKNQLAINSPDDSFEREADRAADSVLSGRGISLNQSSPASMLHRDDAQTGPPPPKKEPSNEEKYQTALEKFGEAFLETSTGKELKGKAEELGKDFVSSVEGKVIAGTALGGALAALIAANKELPVPIPEIPLDFISPGLKAKLVWEGPMRNPTTASLTLTTKSGVSVGASYTKTDASPGKPAEQKEGLTLTIPLGGSPSKPKSDSDKNEKYRADTARMAADQDKFSEGMKPAAQKAAENKEYWDMFWRMKAGEKKKDDLMLMREATHDSPGAGTAPPIVHDVLSESGKSLDATTRGFMESRFGHDFSGVRVHTGSKAEESARAVNASAYTVGRDLVFGAGRFSPHLREGQRLLAHELTHVVQQGQAGSRSAGLTISSPRDRSENEAQKTSQQVMKGLPVDSVSQADFQIARQAHNPNALMNPAGDELAENPYRTPGDEQAEEFRRGTISVVRDPILEALRRNDSITFLNRLHALDDDDRRQLEGDASFLAEIGRALHGTSFWIVLLILHFGQTRPDYVRQLQQAVFERDRRRIKDLLRSDSRLRNPATVPGVREMIEWEFRAAPDVAEMRQIISENETGIGTHTVAYDEVHYEQNKTTGAWELQNFGSSNQLDMARTAAELRIIVRIKFVQAAAPAQTYYPSDELSARWRGGIDDVWNNHFSAFNGATRLKIVFVPVFNDQSNPPNQTVTVHSGSDRANQSNWYETDSARTAAHEFGHMIGNPDEYRLPKKISDVPAKFKLSEADKKRTTVEGIGDRHIDPKKGKPGQSMQGIMGEGKEAQGRQVWPLLDWFNNTIKPANEADYALEKK